jgi:hypothetical protein
MPADQPLGLQPSADNLSVQPERLPPEPRARLKQPAQGLRLFREVEDLHR